MTTIQILFASDLEGGIDALENAPNFAAIEDALEQDALLQGYASVTLSAGDNFIPGPFFNAGGDTSLLGTLEGFYNELFGLIDRSLLTAAMDLNSDGFFDNDEIEAAIDGSAVTFAQVYTVDVNGDGFADYFEEIDAFEGRVDIAIMNAVGFDATAFGNHEFDAGTDALENIINFDSEEGNSLSSGRFGSANFLQEVDTPGAQFPFLAANLDFGQDFDVGALFTSEILDRDAFRSDLAGARVNPLDPAETGPDGRDAKVAPATIIDLGAGEQLGVLGATTQLVAQISSTGDINDISSPGVNDMAALAAVLQPVIDEIINGADNTPGNADDVNKVVLVSHLQQFALEQELAGLLRGVDVIIAGGSGTLSADGQDPLRAGETPDRPFPVIVNDLDNNPTAIVSSDSEFAHVGRLVVEFDANGNIIPGSIDAAVSGAFKTDDAGVLAATGATTVEDAIAASEAATQVKNLVEGVRNVVTVQDGNIFGETEVFLNGERSSVRTEETNFGNLSADANLFAAQQVDPEVIISIKNGGGIRASIGSVSDNGDGSATLGITEANALSGKEAGEISELDVVNALRFNNQLVTVDLTPAQLKIVLEHAVAASGPGLTPGQFAQVGGLQFSFDVNGVAQVLGAGGAVLTEGTRVKNVALIDENGVPTQNIIVDGEVAAGAPASLRTVTLNFLADGGDGFPLGAFSPVVDLNIGEQQALADFLTATFPKDAEGFDQADLPVGLDSRIQNLSERADSVGQAPVNATLAAEFQGEGGEAASEVVAHEGGLLYTTNGTLGRIDIFDIGANTAAGSIDLTALPGFDGVQSVDVKNGIVAAAISRGSDALDIFGQTLDIAQPGFIALFDAATGDLLSTVETGNLPDAVKFSPDGATLAVAGEGEFNEDSPHANDPLGTVSLIDVSDPVNPQARTIDFTAFNGLEDAARAAGIRVKEGASIGADFEPEFTAFSPDGAKLFVSLQENNAIARIDVASGQIESVFSLGTVDFASESKLDADDNGIINIRNFDNLVGLRMPDAIATFGVGGENNSTYILTANEGDDRGFDAARVSQLASQGRIDPSVNIAGLERLTVSTVDGDTDDDGDIDVLHTLSSRSFSIFDDRGNLVFDSGDEFEQIIAARAPERFNDDQGRSGAENRADNKGPEPEAVAVGQIGERSFAFIGLERDSGIMVYDVTSPADSFFVQYIPPQFGPGEGGSLARQSPETIVFIPAEESASGMPQIAVAHEISGTTAVFDLALDGAGLSLTGSDADDVLIGGTGDDTIDGAGGANRLRGEDGNDLITSGDGADTLNGGNGADTLVGGLTEADLRDLIFGGAGDDSIDGGYGNDELRGMDGNDAILGGFGADMIVGGAGEDVLSGAAGSDLIFGNDDDDFLNGGFGNDRMNGGAGADTFFHLGVEGHGTDWIQDYAAADGDVLLFGGVGASADRFALNFANTSAGSVDVAEAFVSDTQTGQILFVLVDGAAQDSILMRIAGAPETFDLLA
jgi:alkaline phosphatase